MNCCGTAGRPRVWLPWRIVLLLLALLSLNGCSLLEPLATLVASTEVPAATLAPASPTPRVGSSATAARPSPAATVAQLDLKIPTPLAGDRLPTIRVDKLPPEAQTVIRLIARGGPFPYRQDGQTFQNREKLLPNRAADYYREYTVETPGSPDRGARRLVRGGQGELYYTDDHYASFRRVIP